MKTLLALARLIDALTERIGRIVIWLVLGGLRFLLPMAVLLAWLAWPMFHEAWVTQEHSPDAGGLLRWPVKLLLPLGGGPRGPPGGGGAGNRAGGRAGGGGAP